MRNTGKQPRVGRIPWRLIVMFTVEEMQALDVPVPPRIMETYNTFYGKRK